MKTYGKKFRAASERRDIAKSYEAKQAIALVKQMSFAKFDETVEVAVRLGVDPRHEIGRASCRERVLQVV